MRVLFLLAGVTASVVALSGCASDTPRDDGREPDPIRTSIVLTSFVSEEAGMFGGETGPFVNGMDDAVEITEALPFCRRVWEGSLHDQPITAVAAGSGKVEVGLCMEDLLRHYRGRKGIKEVIWSGIAGGTPAVGGLVDNEGRSRSGTVVAIGDVCISYFALDWDRQYQSVDQEPRWWARPPKPNYQSVGDSPLATEIYRAAKDVSWPPVPEGAARTTDAYHGDGAAREAKIFDWEVCGEITADMFWHGLSEDRRARTQIAELISAVLEGEERSAEEVIAVSACNNTAWMNTLDIWAERTAESIPFAYTRAISNYTHPPLDEQGRPRIGAMSSIRWSMTEGEGGAYAATTAALPILKMFELRAAR